MVKKIKTLEELENSTQFTADDVVKVSSKLGFYQENPLRGRQSINNKISGEIIQLYRDGESLDSPRLSITLRSNGSYSTKKAYDIINTLRDAENLVEEEKIDADNIVSNIELMNRVGSLCCQNIVSH